MTRGLAALPASVAFALFVLASVEAGACPAPSDELRFHSCWGESRLDIVLLPEDLPLPPPADHGRRMVVTGTYTARDTREGGLPKPVGLFVHAGKVVNPNLGRMDGVLIVAPSIGRPEILHRSHLSMSGQSYDLTQLDDRRHFQAHAAASGISVLQSHLLVIDGKVDARPQDNAPAFVRRFLFTDEFGFGLFQTVRPMTLHEAADHLVSRVAPVMALNLDMGSYDYCQSAQDGSERRCGILGAGETTKLSNLLVLTVE